MTPDGVITVTSILIRLEADCMDSVVDKTKTRVYAGGIYVSPALKGYTWSIDMNNELTLKLVENPNAVVPKVLNDLLKPRIVLAIKNVVFDVSIFDLTANLN